MKKLSKLLNKNVSVGIKLNLSYYSILQYISPIPCCSIVLAICKLMFQQFNTCMDFCHCTNGRW